MSPEYGSTATIFPDRLRNTSLPEPHGPARRALRAVEAYAKDQGLWHDETAEPAYSERIDLDLSSIEPSLAGPSRPQDRVPLRRSKAMF